MFRLLIILSRLFKANIESHLHAPSLWLIKLFFPWTWFYRQKSPNAYPAQIEALGPLFIKLGQWLSTRSDLLNEHWVEALSQLQDSTTPLPWPVMRSQLEKQWGHEWESHFSSIDKTPLASASLAQVYRATLTSNGQGIIIKILKPGVKKQIQQDCHLLLRLAKIGNLISPQLRAMALQPLVQQIYDHLMIETDFSHELGNLSKMAHHAENHQTFITPGIIWPLSNNTIIVQSEQFGLSFSELMNSEDHVQRANAAKQLIQVFLKQVFEYGLFHADWHPGNWRFDPLSEKVILMDFGLVGALSKQDKWAIALNLKAFFDRDYDAVVRYHMAAGWFDRDIDVQSCSSTIRALGERFIHQAQDEKAISALFQALIHMGKTYQLNLQPQLLLLQKSLATLEGLTKQLDPNFNLIDNIGPFLNQWVKQQYQQALCPKNWPKTLFQMLPQPSNLQTLMREMSL